MKMKKNYKVGDKIVDFGQVFRIFKIKKEKDSNGELERIIYFRPYFSQKEKNSIVCSIPVKNIEKAEIRRPISKDKLKGLIKMLKKKKDLDEAPDINKVRELLKTNELLEVVSVIKTLWSDKKKSEVFSTSKNTVFNSAIDMLAEEFAIVDGVSLEKARKKICSALQN
jgi:RNA polymerase-interacting CarD/CdnL/TRCF family regulator